MIINTPERILVIPDVHEEFEIAQTALELYESETDYTIFLGDYFDSFNYDQADTKHFEEHCAWLKDTFTSTRRKGLIGNHDVNYFTQIPNYICSGFAPWKIPIVDNILGSDFWKNWDFLRFYKVGGLKYLFAHGGLHPRTIPALFEFTDDAFGKMNQDLKYNFNLNIYDTMLDAGRCRRGGVPIGGITWLDFNSEFEEIQDLIQIVGHTNGRKIKHKGSSVCLDTSISNVMILNTKTGAREYKRIRPEK